MNIQGDVTSVSSYFNAEISVTYKKETMSLKTIAIYHPLLSTLRGEGGKGNLFQLCLSGDLTCNLCAKKGKKNMPMDNQECNTVTQ